MIFLSTETNKFIVKGGDLLNNVEEEGFTRLHCKYTTTSKYLSDWKVHIHKTSYLINNTSAEKLRLLHAINIPLAPESHNLKKLGGSLNFILIFPAIPKSWIKFDFIENAACSCDGFNIRDLERNSSGIYRINEMEG